MSKQAHLADGTILDFPDETPDDVMDAAIKHHIATENLKAAQAAKHPTAKEAGTGPIGAVAPQPGYVVPALKDIAHRGAQFIEEQGPEMAGAAVGGIAGAPLGPAGVIAGGAEGAAVVRAARLAYRAKYGDTPAPSTIGEAASDIGGQAIGGALQEAGPEVAKLGSAAIDAAASRVGVSASGVGSPAAAAAKTVGPLIKSRLTPEQQSAIDLAKTKPALDAAISQDVKTGSRVLSGAKAAVRNLPGAAGIIDENETAARAGYQELGSDIGNRIGQTPGKTQLGDQIQSTVAGEGNRIDTARQTARDAAIGDARASVGGSKGALELMSDLGTAKQAGAQAEKDVADTAYDAFRKVANDPANAKEVQVGTKQVTTQPVGGIAGTAVSKTVPDMQTINSPVDLTAAKSALRPIFQRLKSASDVVRRDASPGYQALADFMNLPDQISANDAIAQVSALGKIGYGGAFKDFPAMADVSAGITRKTWQLTRDALDKTAADIGAKDSLDAGRVAVGEKIGTYGTQAAKAAAKSAETKPIETLIRDNNITGVKSILDQTNSAELPAMRRRVIDGFISDSTGTDGKVDAVQLARKWNSIGDELKGMIFTPDQIAKMDKASDPSLLYGPNHPVTRAYNTVKGLVSGSPADAVNALTKKDEVGLPELRQVLRLNPSLASPLGRTVFQGIMDGSTNANGDFLAAQAFRKWNGLGMQTKLALTGNDAKLVQDVDSFFRLGSMMKSNANPSGTAPVAALAKFGGGLIEGVGAGLGAVVHGLPGAETGAAAAAMLKIGSVPLMANQVAKLLYSKDGAALLTKALTLPSTSPAAEALMERILGKAVASGAIPHN